MPRSGPVSPRQVLPRHSRCPSQAGAAHSAAAVKKRTRPLRDWRIVTFNGPCWKTAVQQVLTTGSAADGPIGLPHVVFLQELRLRARQIPTAIREADA